MGLDAFIQPKERKDVWEKFNEMRQYMISKGYDKTKAWVEAAKLVLKPETKPMAKVQSTGLTSKSIVKSITFILDEKSYPLVTKFFDSNRNDIVSWHKAKILVEIVERLVK